MLHLAGGVGVGGDVGDLLELQRALERDGQPDVAADVEEELLAQCSRRSATWPATCSSPTSLPRRRRRSARQPVTSAIAARQALDLGDQLAQALGGERAAQLGEAQAEQVDDGDLADEGLGRGDADLEARRA